MVLLSGRHAGRKALIVRTFEMGTKDHTYGHCIVAGIERTPRKITKGLGAKKVARRSQMKPFIKMVNYNHVLPTRYQMECDLKEVVKVETVHNPDQKKKALQNVGKAFMDR